LFHQKKFPRTFSLRISGGLLSLCIGFGLPQTGTAYDLTAYESSPRHAENSRQLFLSGKQYHDGDGVKQDYAKAYDLYLKAAALGNNDARINLGYMYFVGEGVQQSYAAARGWYLDAADTSEARQNLAAIYEYGLGVEKDPEAAKAWRHNSLVETTEFETPVNDVFSSAISVNTPVAQGNWVRPVNAITDLTPAPFPVDAGSPVSFRQALDAAFAFNPRLLAVRQEYAISETDVSLAKAGRRPSIEANGSFGYLDQNSDFNDAQSSSISGDTSNLGLSLTQPLFRGFQTRNGVLEATSLSRASLLQIAAVEQAVFLDVATAYLGVQRDLNILELNQENLDTLEGQLKANEKRYQLKDASLTDVARSQAAIASVVSRTASVRGNYADTRSTFFRLTGLSADNLVTLAEHPVSLPRFDDFITLVQNRNAAVLSAEHALEAAEFALKQAKGSRLPTVDFNSSISRNEGPVNFGLFSDNRVTTSASANVTVRVPIYQAGQEFDNIKRAKQVRRLREIELSQVRANVRDDARTIWDRLGSTQAALASYEEATEAAETAAVGTREIYRSGLISAIDLIDTEQTLLDSKVEQERARHDHLIALYTLFSLVGEIHV